MSRAANVVAPAIKILVYILALLIWLDIWPFLPQQSLTWACLCYLALTYIRETLNNMLFPLSSNISALVELGIQLVLERMEIAYLCVTAQGPLPLLLFVPCYYLYDFIFRFFYRFDETDYFTYFWQFFFFQLCISLYWQEDLTILIAFHIVFFLMRFVTIWILQWTIARGSELSSVLVLSSLSTADSSHLIVKAGEYTHEIFKKDGTVTSNIVPQEKYRAAVNIRPWQQFYIPFISYGILGLTTYDRQAQENVYNALIKSNTRYDMSSNSCQEFAFSFANKIVIPGTAVKMSMTNLKSFLTIVMFYAVPLIYMVAKNIVFRISYA